MGKSIRVLLIDDDVITLRIQKTMLTRKGYEVFMSETAEDIFNTIEKYTPDIIIMDQGMPEVSGMDAIKQLKSNVLSGSIPVILFSFYENMAEEAIQAGAAAYIWKGGAIDDLADCIDRVILRGKE